MEYFLAIIFPGIAVICNKRVGIGTSLLILQITIVGWLPATLIAFHIISKEKKRKNINQAIQKALLQKSFLFKHWKNHAQEVASHCPRPPQKYVNR
ncbi:MAG: YqaE/Pmp3 family membrane protein [SAR324 cluster bacterium]|nr:YqaE/Pmp3 family membrane protein [SAR324 cluster bacterium]